MQWLRDGLGLIKRRPRSSDWPPPFRFRRAVLRPRAWSAWELYWDPYARGAIVGIERGTQAGHLARAAVEAMAYQTKDLISAMEADAGVPLRELKVDGGATVNNDLLQFQADLLNVPVQRPVVAETTALGAAYLAGLAVGYWDGPEQVAANWALDREFRPQLAEDERNRRYALWRRAVGRSQRWLTDDAI